jgi:hypothetical protein
MFCFGKEVLADAISIHDEQRYNMEEEFPVKICFQIKKRKSTSHLNLLNTKYNVGNPVLAWNRHKIVTELYRSMWSQLSHFDNLLKVFYSFVTIHVFLEMINSLEFHVCSPLTYFYSIIIFLCIYLLQYYPRYKNCQYKNRHHLKKIPPHEKRDCKLVDKIYNQSHFVIAL